MSVRIIQGDCRDFGARDESFDSIVTDPPYGLAFMGKGWDQQVPGPDYWTALLATAKPGAHLVAFGGTRTFHRLTCAIEDAGWEIRDCLMWMYGSGMAKSLNVSKAIDKAAGVEFSSKPASGVGFMNPDGKGGYNNTNNQLTRQGASTDAAKQWDGWGTALSPSWEPIILARKPLIGTVARNVTTHGTGGLNIEGCRIGKAGGTSKHAAQEAAPKHESVNAYGSGLNGGGGKGREIDAGRWPANVILDPEAGAMLDAQTGTLKSGGPSDAKTRSKSTVTNFGPHQGAMYSDSGGASRFFYCAKSSKSEREAGLVSQDDGTRTNTHPTVKPVSLMRWLCRLVTPPGGTVLDPFMGSGTTLLAARAEGFSAVGVDIDEKHCDIARARLWREVEPDECDQAEAPALAKTSDQLLLW